MNKNKYTFNFNFHPIPPGTDKVLLYCQGIPFTCGNYIKNENGYVIKYSSYIFQEGHGTPIFFNGEYSWANDTGLTEIEVRELLIKNAVQLIMDHHDDKPIKIANGHII